MPFDESFYKQNWILGLPHLVTSLFGLSVKRPQAKQAEMKKSFSYVTGRLCSTTGKTVVTAAHGHGANRPRVIAQPLQAAVCTMGARGGRLRQSLQMKIRAEAGSTLMIDSVMPTRLLPSNDTSVQYGVKLHASVEEGSLLVITPNAHVPHANATAGLWTRCDTVPS